MTELAPRLTSAVLMLTDQQNVKNPGVDKPIPNGIRPITDGIGRGDITRGAVPSVFNKKLSYSEFWRAAVTSRLAKLNSAKSLSNSHKFLRSTRESTIYETEYVVDSVLYFAARCSVSQRPLLSA